MTAHEGFLVLRDAASRLPRMRKPSLDRPGDRIIIRPRRSARRLAAAGEEGRFGTLRPLSAAARRDIRRFRSVPKRGFAFSSTSRGAFRPANPGLSHSRSDRFRRLGLTERLSLFPVDGRETPVRRRAACPGTGVAVPDGAGPRPRSLTRETRPCVSGSEGEIGIFSGYVKSGRWGIRLLDPEGPLPPTNDKQIAAAKVDRFLRPTPTTNLGSRRSAKRLFIAREDHSHS